MSLVKIFYLNFYRGHNDLAKIYNIYRTSDEKSFYRIKLRIGIMKMIRRVIHSYRGKITGYVYGNLQEKHNKEVKLLLRLIINSANSHSR